MKKRLLALVLALLMLLCTACGKDEDSKDPAAEPNQTGEAAQPTFAYKANYFPIDTTAHQIQYINSLCMGDGSLFFIAACQTGTEVYVDEVTGEPYLDENGETMEISVQEYCLFRMDLATQALTKLELGGFEPEEGKLGDSYFGTMTPDGQGGFWVMEQTYSYHYDLPEGFDPANGDYYQYYVDDGSQMLCHHLTARARSWQPSPWKVSRRFTSAM